MKDGAYRIGMTLPSDRTGHQVLYTIWQNSSTADTYYSCSDVVFPAAKGSTGGAKGRESGRVRDRRPVATPAAARPSDAESSAAAEQPAPVAESAHGGGRAASPPTPPPRRPRAPWPAHRWPRPPTAPDRGT